MQKQFTVILFFAIKIGYASLYISTYRDKQLCYRLEINCLSKHILEAQLKHPFSPQTIF